MNSFRSALNSGEGIHPSGPLMPGKKPSGANEAKGLGSVPVARETIRTVNHRDDDRHRLQSESATLRVGRKSHKVELVNLSGGGAMVRTDAALNMWQKVHLALGDCEPLECAVRWIRGDRIGLEFAHETQIGGDPVARAAMLLDVIQRSFPDLAEGPVALKAPEPVARPGGSSSGQQRRAGLRHPLIWSGELLYNHDLTRVRLRNISDSGALVDSDTAFPPEAEVLLDLAGAGQHFAIVSWSRGDQVGLRFVQPFDIALLSKVKPQVADHQWTRPDYLRGTGAEATSAGGWQSRSLPELRQDLEGFLKR